MPNLNDPITKLFLTNLINAQYGGSSQQTQDLLNNLFSNAGDSSALKNTEFLTTYLKDALTNGLPFKDQLRQTSSGTINTAFNTAGTRLSETLAGRGTLRSGIGSAAQIALAGERGKALASNEASLNTQDISFRENAIAKLLGIDQLNLSEAGLNQNFLQTLLSGKNAADVNNFNIEQNKFNLLDLIPGLFEGGAKIGASLLAPAG